MAPKAHGTSAKPVQKKLRWNCDRNTADRICNFNRHAAEYRGFWKAETHFMQELNRDEPTIYYDSVTGVPLFVAPIGRSMDSFLVESDTHGWPSFRDSEVVWENVRVIKTSGEAVSTTGTHLGHNLPDSKGNRYCINLVSIAGLPGGDETVEAAASDAAVLGEDNDHEDAPKVPGFLLWLGFVWVGVPAILVATGVQVPEHL